MKNKNLYMTIAILIIAMSSLAQVPGTFTDTRDGKVYKTVTIGTQTWMVENFAYKSSSGCIAYNEDETNVTKYGYLYNWETAKEISPEGWHLPSDAEWTTLTNNLGGVSIAGEKMKSKIGWNDYNNKSGNGTNTSGFNALPGGIGQNMAGLYNSFDFIGTYGIWWTASIFKNDVIWNRTINNNGTNIISDTLWDKNCYLSVRYVKNSTDQGTGSIIKSATDSPDQTQNSFTDTRDGNIYQTVTIGTQTWMAENLKYMPSVVGLATGSQTTPYYYVYNYDGNVVAEAITTDNYSTYGVLYNWPAAMNGVTSSTANPSGVQGVCPTGWHLPSDGEWTQLTDYLGGTSLAGGKLMETGTSHWLSSIAGVTNETGFTALPGGSRYHDGRYNGIGEYGVWWSATERTYDQPNTDESWYQSMHSNNIIVVKTSHYKKNGFSVRCVKD